MSVEVQRPRAPTDLVTGMIDLANAIDGVVDFGMSVCFMDEEKFAGRHSYISQRCREARSIVTSLVASIKNLAGPDQVRLPRLQAELVANTDLFLNAFASLVGYRNLQPEIVRSLTNAIQVGWEAIHQSLKGVAEEVGVFDESWYSPIRERKSTYRNTLMQVLECFPEASAVAWQTQENNAHGGVVG